MTNLPVPATATAAPGNFITAALWNAQVRDAVGFLLNPPMFQGTQLTPMNSTAAGIWVSMAIDGETIDSYGGHSTTTNNDRYVAQVAGYYEVIGSVTYIANASGTRGARIAVNGAAVQGSAQMIFPSGGSTDTSVGTVARVVFLNVGDYVSVQGWQSSGGTLNTKVDSDLASSLYVCWKHT
jgi:hypothetical protein